MPGQFQARDGVESHGRRHPFLDLRDVQLGQVLGLNPPGRGIGQAQDRRARRRVFAGRDVQRYHRPGEGRHETGGRELLGREIAGDLGRLDAGLEHRPVAGRRLEPRQRRFGVFERRELRLDLGRIGRQPIQRGLGSLHLGGGGSQLRLGWVGLRIFAGRGRGIEVVGGLLELQTLGPGADIRRALDLVVGRLRLVERGARVVDLCGQVAQLLGSRAGAHLGVVLLGRGQRGARRGHI